MNQEVTPVLKSWQFFLSCRKVLGDSFLVSLYNRGMRQIYRWSADPDFTSKVGYERNPLDRIKTLLVRLTEIGRTDVAVSGLSILAHAIDYEVTPINSPLPDQQTVEAEMLDDYPALLKFHEAIRQGAPIEEIRLYLWAAKIDLDGTMKKYEWRCEREGRH